MYALLCGKLPFFEDDVKELYRKIAFANYEMPAYVSPCRWPLPLASFRLPTIPHASVLWHCVSTP